MRAGEKLPTHCFGESKITSTRWGLVIARLPDFCNGAPFWWAGASVLDLASALPRVFPLTELRAVSRRKLRKTCLNLLSNVGQVGNDEVFELECSIHVRRLVHLDEYKLLPQVWLHCV